MNTIHCLATVVVGILYVCRIGGDCGFEEDELAVAIKYLKNQGLYSDVFQYHLCSDC